MMSKVLTISIAAYNSENYIQECLDSILPCKNQDLIEIFVIDDGGTDNTLNIANKYKTKYPNIVFPVHKENGGWGSTVNYSIHNAHGKYLRILDADDMLDKNVLDNFISFLNNSDSDIVFSNFYEFNDLKKIKKISKNSVINMHAITFKNSIFSDNTVSITENLFYTDVELVFYAIKYATTFSYFIKPIYIYRIARDGQSVTKEQFIKRFKEHEIVTKNVLNLYYSFKDNCIILPDKVYDRLIELVNKHFSILYMLEKSDISKKLIIDFDNFLKLNFRDVYNSIDLKRVKLLRNSSNFYYIIKNILSLRSYIYSIVK